MGMGREILCMQHVHVGRKSVFEVDFQLDLPLHLLCPPPEILSPLSPSMSHATFQLGNLLWICFIVLPWLMAMQVLEMGSVTILDTLPGFNFILRS